jgi:hypothetical protein
MLAVELQGLGYGGGTAWADTDERLRLEELQRTINTYMAKWLPKATQLVVDGNIGVRTVAARNTVVADIKARTGTSVLMPKADPIDIAKYATVDILAIKAATLGAGRTALPDTPSVPPGSNIVVTPVTPPAVPTAGGKQAISPYAILAILGTVGLAGVGIVWARKRSSSRY